MNEMGARLLADTEAGGAMPARRPAVRTPPLLAVLAAVLMSGCTVGPDFQKPAAPAVESYTAHPLVPAVATADVAGGATQHFAKGGDIPGDWWTLFHSQPLNALIERSLANNPDLKAAQAALTVARENMLAGRGSRYPSISAGITASREQDPPGALAPVPSNNAFLYNLFTPQVSVSYVPDVFGLNRRSNESLQAQDQAALRPQHGRRGVQREPKALFLPLDSAQGQNEKRQAHFL